ncbi:MAG: general secretion pathway protein GspK [Phycisphaerales bacterium JB063]
MPRTPRPTRARDTRQRGAAFIITLLITTVLASLVLVFAHRMRTQAETATHHAASTQARWIALGALEAVRGDLADAIANGESPYLANVGVAGEPMGDGLYWIIAPDYNDDTLQTYGLVGEASKLNLNNAPVESLIELPGMTEDLAAAIVDWRDEDTETTPGGAESDYYLTRATPYNAKDGNYETLGELAYVRGMDVALLYGEDTNRNGRLDDTEDDGPDHGAEDNADGRLDRGLYGLATVYSVEPNTGLDGEDLININEPSQELAQLIQQQLGEERLGELAGTIPDNRPYDSVLDFYIKNKLTEDEFELIHDRLLVPGQGGLVGRVDPYTASAEVLEALPGMEPGDGDLILGARPILQPGEEPGSLAWLVDVLGDDKAAEVGARLTHRSLQFTVDIVAVTNDGRGYCRLRFVIDTRPTIEDNDTLPEIVYVQDLTTLGWPMDPAILEQLQQGVSTAEVAEQYAAE